MKTVRVACVALAMVLAGCGTQAATDGAPPVCTPVITPPSLEVYAPTEPGGNTATYVVTAPSTLVVKSDGAYGNSGCATQFVQSLSLVVGDDLALTETRTVKSVTEAREHPFMFSLPLEPGKAGIPTSGEVLLRLRLQSQQFGQFDSLPEATVKVIVR
ncbi:hypothetical protein [Deinococcus peraridilitoris]|uniref:Lipoprotein n=1 Tax=Deinococcus peraridilitoris (strain DSM 19664 / LMG 22246 / CIP 109416 / KR-200) TaxID=937777 RepID=K9ZYH4_DEIPD|nr:hypothetical protein [Deinococcus peraridilitoris]AFZ66698.1 hypothetical protein Deipe_1139 [Deinococcus peraridilitoris DSM 19664]